jgi:hypothetical protein
VRGGESRKGRDWNTCRIGFVSSFEGAHGAVRRGKRTGIKGKKLEKNDQREHVMAGTELEGPSAAAERSLGPRRCEVWGPRAVWLHVTPVIHPSPRIRVCTPVCAEAVGTCDLCGGFQPVKALVRWLLLP